MESLGKYVAILLSPGLGSALAHSLSKERCEFRPWEHCGEHVLIMHHTEEPPIEIQKNYNKNAIQKPNRCGQNGIGLGGVGCI